MIFAILRNSILPVIKKCGNGLYGGYERSMVSMADMRMSRERSMVCMANMYISRERSMVSMADMCISRERSMVSMRPGSPEGGQKQEIHVKREKEAWSG